MNLNQTKATPIQTKTTNTLLIHQEMHNKKCITRNAQQEMRNKKCATRNAQQEMHNKKCTTRNAQQEMHMKCTTRNAHEMRNNPRNIPETLLQIKINFKTYIYLITKREIDNKRTDFEIPPLLQAIFVFWPGGLFGDDFKLVNGTQGLLRNRLQTIAYFRR